MDVLLLRLEAPLMSFGAPIVDRNGVIQPYPALSTIAGLLGNALGYDHSEFNRLERLQERLVYASRQDRRGRQIQDYQTVDLSATYMQDDHAWTTGGELEKRKGGKASTGTHVRLRDYWADASHIVAIALETPGEDPTLNALERALQSPERPLFIGRKPCLPSLPLYAGRIEAVDLIDALRKAPLARRADPGGRYRAWWPTRPDGDEFPADMRQPRTDRRDWANQIHVGERWIAEGEITMEADEGDHE